MFAFLAELEGFLRERSADFPAGEGIRLERTPDGMSGDVTVNCFRFARFCGVKPDAAAAMATEFLQKHPDVEKAEAVKAFVNITLTPAALFRATAGDRRGLLESGLLPRESRRRILIEFSAPNTNKPQHLGHVRNNTLGAALSSLLARVGHDVIRINLVNDRGIHICKSMIAYQRWGENCTPESTGIKGDHLVGNFYVRFNQELAKEVAALKEVRRELAEKDADALFLDTELGRATAKMLQDWEAGNEAVRALWDRMNRWVFDGFAVTYRRMGIEFQHTYLESQTYLLGKDLVKAGLDKGVFARREDGAVYADLGKLGKKVVLRNDGTSVYITQDLGTTLLKHNDYKPDTMIWVVGDEQNLHFQMLFTILKKLGYDWADSLYHLSYGMVNLPSGKMKSREGTVVDADDLFDEMSRLAAAACLERDPEMGEDEAASRGELIGMGALKFMLLKFNPKTTMMFDPEASVRFDGDTGAYVQYACARIGSILRKAAERGIAADPSRGELLGTPEEKALEVRLSFYGETLKNAAEKRDCSVLVEYLLSLAKDFSRFYRECPVLNAEVPALAGARLALSSAVREVLADGLQTLTIGVPDAM